MSESNLASEQKIFGNLPKEQQKALRKEFNKTSKPDKRTVILITVLCTVFILLVVVSVFGHSDFYYTTPFPIFLVAPIAAMNEERFSKWLLDEKNIILELGRKRRSKKNSE